MGGLIVGVVELVDGAVELVVDDEDAADFDSALEGVVWESVDDAGEGLSDVCDG